MTLAVVRSRALDGLAAPPVQVEVHLANGLPSFTLVGLLVLNDAHCWSISRSPGYLVVDLWLH